MSELFDRDKLRERLVGHLEKNHMIPIAEMAKRIGISHVALLNFIHAAKESHRKTLGIVRDYLESLENGEEI